LNDRVAPRRFGPALAGVAAANAAPRGNRVRDTRKSVVAPR